MKRPKRPARGPLPYSEGARRRNARNTVRKEERAKYLRETRERAEWGIALLKYLEAAGQPVVFRKADLIALRK